MRPEFKRAALKLLYYLLLLYLTAAAFYTATSLHSIITDVNDPAVGSKPSSYTFISSEQDTSKPNALQEADSSTVIWSNAQGVVQTMSEQFMMAKVFSDAMGPGDMTPYYFRASTIFDQEDITMATLVTRNRFPVLSRLASNYQGPISATVHVLDDETKDEVLRELKEMYGSNPDMRKFVDLHLIIDKYDRQFNMWRNVAKLFARTEYIMMLDVDFHLCTDLRKSIHNNPEIMERLRTGRTALVVPAFEFNNLNDGNDYRTFPTTKASLVNLVEDQKVDMFHKFWLKGHGATNYSHWYTADDLYKVTHYDFSYEPYIIYKKEGSPWCDERFIGYGANKAACLYEIYLSGIEYWVLPNDFLVHQTHRYPEDARKKERQYNRKVYINFREEVCLRYARIFSSSGEWWSPRSENLKNECQKIYGLKKIMQSTFD